MKTAQDVEDEQELRGVRAILSRPEARAHYKRLGQTHWIQSFVESGDRVYRRLGMKLLLREVVDLVDPEYSRAYSLEEPTGTRVRKRTGRATCGECGQIVSLKLNGTMRSHGTGALRSYGTPCRMTGQRPVPRTDGPISGVRDAADVRRPEPDAAVVGRLEVEAIRRARAAVLDADVVSSVKRVTAEHRDLIVYLAKGSSSLERAEADPFWALPWPVADEPPLAFDCEWPAEEIVPDTEREAPATIAKRANPNWVADLARAEAEDFRERLAVERKERREERARVRAERLERAARLGIVRRP